MKNDSNYETFLFCSKKRFILSVIQTNESKTIYEKEIFFENDLNLIKFENLDEFLENNIFDIEKKINSFIKDINLILRIDDFFPIQISIKKDNNGDKMTPKSLAYSLNEAKELCSKNFDKKKIIHMIIDNYRIDNKDYTMLPKNIICNHFSLDLRFICLPNLLVKNLEKSLKKYQISIKKILSYNYIESLFDNNNYNLFQKTQMVVNGFNENEVKLEKKSIRKQGFFEKFFNYFS